LSSKNGPHTKQHKIGQKRVFVCLFFCLCVCLSRSPLQIIAALDPVGQMQPAGHAKHAELSVADWY